MAGRINSRRGTSSASDSKLGLLKCIFLSSLLLIIGFLIQLNYRLMTSLHQPVASNAGGEEAQAKLSSLRKEVKAVKEEVASMSSAVSDLQGASSNSNNNSNKSASHKLSGSISNDGSLQRLTCTPAQAEAQMNRSNQRFQEWWSHSACPDQAWMNNIHSTFAAAVADADNVMPSRLLSPKDKSDHTFLVLDIGCNKGYTSADFFDALSPGTRMNPRNLVSAIRQIAKEDGVKYDREGGVCNDANKPLNSDTASVRGVEVHCFEPSPATYSMLTRAHEKLMGGNDDKNKGKAKWNIHNLGMHQVSGEMKWHSACKDSVGNELCGIVSNDTKDSITVPVVTVDDFLVDTYKVREGESMPLVHMLKVDAEGLDPAVLTGSTRLLTQNRAMMVMFEFNPGLGEGKNPHGMWGKHGNPHKDLLEVTSWLDSLGYDCYLDTHVPSGKEVGTVPEAPALYRINGDCLTKEPRVRGWANVVCASRKWGSVAWELRRLATMIE